MFLLRPFSTYHCILDLNYVFRIPEICEREITFLDDELIQICNMFGTPKMHNLNVNVLLTIN